MAKSTRALWVVVLTAVSLLLAQPAQAGVKCFPQSYMEEWLEEEHGETLKFVALQHNGHLLRVYRSEATGTYTITVTNPMDSDLVCPVSSGHDFQSVVSTPVGDPA